MREEITEPKHWRTLPVASPSWSVRRRAEGVSLPTELVDAAFDDDGLLAVSQFPAEPTTYSELVTRIHEQLAVLETQRSQLQQLLAESEITRS